MPSTNMPSNVIKTRKIKSKKELAHKIPTSWNYFDSLEHLKKRSNSIQPVIRTKYDKKSRTYTRINLVSKTKITPSEPNSLQQDDNPYDSFQSSINPKNKDSKPVMNNILIKECLREDKKW
jgi:hypothetical protein